MSFEKELSEGLIKFPQEMGELVSTLGKLNEVVSMKNILFNGFDRVSYDSEEAMVIGVSVFKDLGFSAYSVTEDIGGYEKDIIYGAVVKLPKGRL